MRAKRRVLLVASAGGHLMQLHAVSDLFAGDERVWVSFEKEDARSLLAGETTYWAHFPTTRSVRNFVRNLRLAWRVVQRERPDLIISTGAGVAVPFFLLGRLRGATLIYIEVYDRIDSPTLTGRLCQPLSDLFALQWPDQQRFYDRGIVLGPLL